MCYILNEEQRKRLDKVHDATEKYCQFLTRTDGSFSDVADDIEKAVGKILRDKKLNVYVPNIKRDANGRLRGFDRLGEEEADKAAKVCEIAWDVLADRYPVDDKTGMFVCSFNDEDASVYGNVTDTDELYELLVEEKEEEIFFTIYAEVNKNARGIMNEDKYGRVLKGYLRASLMYDDSKVNKRPVKALSGSAEISREAKADQISKIAREALKSLCPYDKRKKKFVCELDPSETFGEDINDPEGFIARVLRDEKERIDYNVKYAVRCSAPGILDGQESVVESFIKENVIFDDEAIREELHLTGR